MPMIDKTMTIREVLALSPEAARIMMGFGMHCLGCPHATAESLEEAGMAHGVDVEEMVRQLNVVIEENKRSLHDENCGKTTTDA